MDKGESASGGLAFMVFLVFLVLKLTNTVSWSWWWVTAPLWGGLALASVFLISVLVVVGCGFIVSVCRGRS